MANSSLPSDMPSSLASFSLLLDFCPILLLRFPIVINLLKIVPIRKLFVLVPTFHVTLLLVSIIQVVSCWHNWLADVAGLLT